MQMPRIHFSAPAIRVRAYKISEQRMAEPWFNIVMQGPHPRGRLAQLVPMALPKSRAIENYVLPVSNNGAAPLTVVPLAGMCAVGDGGCDL